MTTASRRSVCLVAALFPALFDLGCAAEAARPGSIRLTSETGAWSAVAVPEPNPAHVGGNALRLDVSDHTGNPVEGALLEVFPWMPAHGHMSSSLPAVVEAESGVYHVEQLDYPMPGRWELRIVVTTRGAVERFNLALDVH
jgi:hypothetical protein